MDWRKNAGYIITNAITISDNTQYQNDKTDYDKSYLDARVKIYQSVNTAFNPDIEFIKDSCYQDIPSVNNSMSAIARKLLIAI